MSTTDTLGLAVLATLRHNFTTYKTLTERALAQLTTAEWLVEPAPGANSAAVIVQHMSGNLRSRFTDFLTTDGEKPDRQRDQEFVQPSTEAEVEALQQRWHATWPILFALLDSLQPADLLRTVTIRGESHTALAALERQATHYAYHSGQVVQLAKQLRGAAWQTLSVPRGQSEQFNQQMRARLNPTAPSGV
ncbi:DUF1572 family protein [Hymenobacter metallicola]|uniref:DUF1572 domain-containing protein n=1 Tax=Hymenobacter metallicola TaxID=2563114 RepID=A0A4Z0QE70_9BACT|nr:DUF1572 family protein [Hymenobacter metallicola]TGE27984.1 DUF1572 domain-containing protein [Hymenobacter metallicola]